MTNSTTKKVGKPVVTLEETIFRAKREIVHDAMAGTVPRDCRSFSSLHDYCDANGYGGFFEDEVTDPLIAHFGGRDSDEGMPDGFMKFVNQVQDSVSQWLLDGGLEKECLPPGWTLADDYTKTTFNGRGNKPYDALYQLSFGPSAGAPLCDLTVLQNGVKFQGVHGNVRMSELDDSPKVAAERAVGWALANGWSENVVRAAQWPTQAAIDPQSLATLPVSVQAGLATTQSGEFVNLLKIQALCNATFQDTGDNEIGEAANELSKLTGLWQGPHGDWFLNTDEQALRPVDISSSQVKEALPEARKPEINGRAVGAPMLYIASFDSRSFSFTALGETEGSARQAMVGGLQAHTAKMGLQADWWSQDDINVDACPIGGCLRDHSLLTGPGVMAGVTAPQQRPLGATTKHIRTDVVFGDAPEPEGMHWRNMCSLENELAAKLLTTPGSIVAIDTDAWVLRESGDDLVLCHATLTPKGLSDEVSRFDFGLEWVDQGVDELQAYNDLLARVIDEFDHRVALEAEVVTRLTGPEATGSLKGPKDCATEGMYSGSIVSVENGVVTQRINRLGETVRHDIAKISAVPPVGSVADVQYREGRGQVFGPGIGKGLGR